MWITYHSISIPNGLYALCCCAVKGLKAAIETLLSLVSSRLDDPGSFYQEKNPLSFKVIFRNQCRNFFLQKSMSIFFPLSYRKLSKLIWEIFRAQKSYSLLLFFQVSFFLVSLLALSGASKLFSNLFWRFKKKFGNQFMNAISPRNWKFLSARGILNL